MRLHDPLALALLALLPLLWRWARRPTPALSYSSVELFRGIGSGAKVRLRRALPLLRVAAFALLVAALARPQLGDETSIQRSEGIDIMLAVDVSSSMLAEDFTLESGPANRLQAVKEVVRQFVGDRAGDRVGLVLFAARPYLQSPLTLDHGWLMANLDRAEVGMIEDGTAVGSALATAVNGLEGSEGEDRAEGKVVILLTDGQNNAGRVTPEAAAEAAATLGYRVYTIGAGTRGIARYPRVDFLGNKRYVPMQVDIDEKTLRLIAQETGGRYFRATDTESLRNIYGEIDQLEKTEHEGMIYLDYHELYPWLAIPALLLLGVEALLAETWLRVLP
jgi:Ca-activated chloride channel family protein